jgi:hypothetical protein
MVCLKGDRTGVPFIRTAVRLRRFAVHVSMFAEGLDVLALVVAQASLMRRPGYAMHPMPEGQEALAGV